MGPTLNGVSAPLWVPAFSEGALLNSILNIPRIPLGRALSERRGNPSSKSSKLPGSPGRSLPRLLPARFTPEPHRQDGLGARRSLPQYSRNSPRQLSGGAPWPTLDPAKSDWVPKFWASGLSGPVKKQASAPNPVGILASLPGHGVKQVAVGHGGDLLKVGNGTDWGPPAAKAASREFGTDPAARATGGLPHGRGKSDPLS